MHHDIPVWVYITFTAVTAVGVLMQALVLLGMLFALKGALGRVNEVSPKLKVAAQNALEVSQTLKEVSQTVRTESTHVASAVDDLLKKASVQADRVDEMVTGTLNSVANATEAVQKAVSGPVRQVGAVLNGLRAGLDVLRNKGRDAHASPDGDHFV
jgi:methyl-accepting chemotaxis protein